MNSLILLMLWSFFAQFCFAQSEEVSQVKNELTLKDAVAYALEHSLEFDSLKRNYNISELEEKSAFSGFFPSLDLTATHGIQDSDPRSSTTSQSQPAYSDFNLSLTESLYDNGQTYRNYRISVLSRKKAQLNYSEQKNKICLDVITQYLSYSLYVKLLEIQQRQSDLIAKQYELVSKDFFQGIKTQKDFLRFKTQLRRSEIDLLNAKNNVERSKLALNKVIGRPVNSTDEIEFAPLSFEQSVNPENIKLSLHDHLLYKISEIQKEINELGYDAVKRKNLPELFFSAGLNYTSYNYVNSNQSFNDNDQLGWNALLTLKYNFIDWGVRSRNSEIAGIRNKIQTNDLDLQLLSLQNTLKELEINLIQIKSNFVLSKELLSLEKDNINFIQREYRNGKVQYLDLITGLNDLSNAEIKYYTSASELEGVKYTQLYHQGTLYEEILK